MLINLRNLLAIHLKIFRQIKLKDLGSFYYRYLQLKVSLKKVFTASFLTELSSFSSDEIKYINYKQWLKECLLRAYKLKLNERIKPLRILDIGTGFGYFPFICNKFGHKADSTDLPDNKLYNLIIEKLDLQRFHVSINAYTPLQNETSERYDLVTAFMITFNNHKTNKLWKEEEWKFFINDLYSRILKKNGKIFLSFNEESPGIFYSNDLEEFFQTNGYKVESNTVFISHPVEG